MDHAAICHQCCPGNLLPFEPMIFPAANHAMDVLGGRLRSLEERGDLIASVFCRRWLLLQQGFQRIAPA